MRSASCGICGNLVGSSGSCHHTVTYHSPSSNSATYICVTVMRTSDTQTSGKPPYATYNWIHLAVKLLNLAANIDLLFDTSLSVFLTPNVTTLNCQIATYTWIHLAANKNPLLSLRHLSLSTRILSLCRLSIPLDDQILQLNFI